MPSARDAQAGGRRASKPPAVHPRKGGGGTRAGRHHAPTRPAGGGGGGSAAAEAAAARASPSPPRRCPRRRVRGGRANTENGPPRGVKPRELRARSSPPAGWCAAPAPPVTEAWRAWCVSRRALFPLQRGCGLPRRALDGCHADERAGGSTAVRHGSALLSGWRGRPPSLRGRLGRVARPRRPIAAAAVAAVRQRTAHRGGRGGWRAASLARAVADGGERGSLPCLPSQPLPRDPPSRTSGIRVPLIRSRRARRPPPPQTLLTVPAVDGVLSPRLCRPRRGRVRVGAPAARPPGATGSVGAHTVWPQRVPALRRERGSRCGR